MHAISIKELRTKLPFVRGELKKGEEFILIYRSRPIAKLSPISDLPDLEEATDLEVEKIALQDIEEDFLTKREVNYYLKLK